MVSVARVQQHDSLADLLDSLSRTRVKMLKLQCEEKVWLLKLINPRLHKSDDRIDAFGSVCNQQRADEEVVVDQGGTSSVMNIHYEKEELEGELTSVLSIMRFLL